MATAFLPSFLTSAQIRARVAWGVDPRSDPTGWTWTDITADVLQVGSIVIQVGRAPESGTAPPAQCSLAVKNLTGAYTQFNPLSSNYPNVREGTPLEVQVFVSGTWYTRFFGFIKGFVPAWDTTGTYAIANVTAYGTTRRLMQGTTPFRSALYRAIALGLTAFGTPIAYWPMEDGQYSTGFVSGIGGPDMTVTGAVQFAQTAGPPGGTQAPDFSGGGTATGVVTAPVQTAYRIEGAFQFPIIPTGGTVIAARIKFAGITAGAIDHIDVEASPNAANGLFLQTYLVGNPTPTATFTGTGVENAWHWLQIDLQFTGTAYGVAVTIDNVNVVNSIVSSTTGFDRLASVIVNPTGLPDSNAPSVEHLTVWPQANSDTFDPYQGFTGEDPVDRMTRLCSEEGENFASDTSGGTVVTMGPQGLKSFIDLLRECELADGGYLFDGLDNGLDYLGVRAMYNIGAVLTVDASTGQVQPPFSPESDDLGRVNDMTVSRTNGGTVEVIDTTSPLSKGQVGVYDNSITINTETDGYLQPRASWEVAKGTFNGFRYPTLSLDLRTIPGLALDWLAVEPGEAIAMKLPFINQLPPSTVELIVQGWTEQLTNLVWTVNPINCTPADPYQVALYGSSQGDPDGARFDAENSTVGTNFTSGATTASIASAAHTQLWTVDVAAFPFDVNVGGEQCTVSAITGASSPQTFTFSHRAVNGITKAHVVGEPVTLWNTPRFAI